MADIEARAKAAVTPRQLLVVGVLGIVLVGVLVSQFGGASGGAGETASEAGAGVALLSVVHASERKETPVAQVKESGAGLAAWPKLTAETAAQHDPFAVPQAVARKIAASARAAEDRKSSSSPQQRDASAENLAALKSKGITLIVRGERGALAMIGNRVVRVGDVLEGHRVVSIDLQGVVLAPTGRQESNEVRK